MSLVYVLDCQEPSECVEIGGTHSVDDDSIIIILMLAIAIVEDAGHVGDLRRPSLLRPLLASLEASADVQPVDVGAPSAHRALALRAAAQLTEVTVLGGRRMLRASQGSAAWTPLWLSPWSRPGHARWRLGRHGFTRGVLHCRVRYLRRGQPCFTCCYQLRRHHFSRPACCTTASEMVGGATLGFLGTGRLDAGQGRCIDRLHRSA